MEKFGPRNKEEQILSDDEIVEIAEVFNDIDSYLDNNDIFGEIDEFLPED